MARTLPHKRPAHFHRRLSQEPVCEEILVQRSNSGDESSDEKVIKNMKTDSRLESRSSPSSAPPFCAHLADVPAPAPAPEAQSVAIGGQAAVSSAASAGAGACTGSVMQTDDDKSNSSSRFRLQQYRQPSHYHTPPAMGHEGMSRHYHQGRNMEWNGQNRRDSGRKSAYHPYHHYHGSPKSRERRGANRQHNITSFAHHGNHQRVRSAYHRHYSIRHGNNYFSSSELQQQNLHREDNRFGYSARQCFTNVDHPTRDVNHQHRQQLHEMDYNHNSPLRQHTDGRHEDYYMSRYASRSGPQNHYNYQSSSEIVRLEKTLKEVELKAKIQAGLLETERIALETERIRKRIQFASTGHDRFVAQTVSAGEDTTQPNAARETIHATSSQQSVIRSFAGSRMPHGSFASSTSSTTTTTTTTTRIATTMVISDKNIIDLCDSSSEEDDGKEDESHHQSQQQQSLPLLATVSHRSSSSLLRGGHLNHHTDNVQRIASSSALSSGLGSPATSLASSSGTKRTEPPPAAFSSPSLPAASSEEKAHARGARKRRGMEDNLTSEPSFAGVQSQYPSLHNVTSAASNLNFPGGTDARPEEDTSQLFWACPSCTLNNPQHHVQCDACCRTNPSLTNVAASRGAEGGMVIGHPLQHPVNKSSFDDSVGWGRNRSGLNRNYRTSVPASGVTAWDGHPWPFENVGGNVRHGASAKIISSLPFIKILDPERQLPEDNRECTICFEEYRIGDERTSLPCLHGFHRDCVNRWLILNVSCPFCKTSVS